MPFMRSREARPGIDPPKSELWEESTLLCPQSKLWEDSLSLSVLIYATDQWRFYDFVFGGATGHERRKRVEEKKNNPPRGGGGGGGGPPPPGGGGGGPPRETDAISN